MMAYHRVSLRKNLSVAIILPSGHVPQRGMMRSRILKPGRETAVLTRTCIGSGGFSEAIRVLGTRLSTFSASGIDCTIVRIWFQFSELCSEAACNFQH
jgi:hypothetical protein